MRNILLYFFLLMCFTVAYSLHLPKYIKNCKVRDPNFKKCAIANGNDVIKIIMKGDRAYNIPPADPLVLPLATVVSDNVNLNITNISLYGLKDMRVTDMDVSLKNQTIYLEIHIPLLRIEFIQRIRGKIAAFVIAGEGPGTVNIYEADYRYRFGFNLTEKNGNRYMTLGNEQFDINPQKMTFRLKNLFDGNDELGNQLTNYMDENWKDVVNAIRPSLNQIGLTLGKLIVDTIIQKVPVNEIFPDF